jgi:hypothetical protein
LIEHPVKSTGLFRLPKSKEKWRWVRACGSWPFRSTKIVLAGLRANSTVLDQRRQIMLIEPEAGYEIGVWQIVIRGLTVAIEKEEAERLLAKHGLL